MATDLLAIAQEQGRQFLDSGESVLAAFQAKPRGSGVASSGGGAAVMAIGGAWAKKSRQGAEHAGLEVTSPMALALTDRRVVVFSVKTSGMSGKVNEITGLVSSAPIEAVDSVQVKRLLVGRTVTIAMGGGEVKLEVPPGQDANGFVELFDRAKATA